MSKVLSPTIPEALQENNRRQNHDELPTLFRGKGSSVNPGESDYSDSRTYSKFETPARTYFKIKDAPSSTKWEERKWKRLQRWHRGTKANWDGYGMENRQSQSQRNDFIFKKSQAACLCGSCDLNCQEKEIVVRQSIKLDYVKFGAHSDIWKGILGLMAVVAESRRPKNGADFEAASLHRQDDFRDLMEFVGIDYSGLKLVKREIRNQLSWIGEI